MARSKRSKRGKKGKGKDAKKAAVLDEQKTVNDIRSSTGVLDSRPTARDIKIGNFSLNAYGKQLIHDSSMELTVGRRYGLIGPNGSGKSQILKCLANREIPIPDFVDIFILEQEVEPSEMTAVEAATKYMQDRMKAMEEEAERLIDIYGPEDDVIMDIYERLDELDPATFEARANKLLKGLGFGADMLAKKTKDMSGGWRMRVSLAQALLVKPTLLLLDEPTNHLDLEAVVWLEKYLRHKFDRCLVIVSHSQDFLNAVCTNIMFITPKQTLAYYSGNYDTFIRTKADLETNQMKQYKKEQADMAKIKRFVAAAGTYSNLVKQSKSKLKIIEKMEEKGLTEKVVHHATSRFLFPDVEQLPTPVLAFYDVGFAYSGLEKDMLYSGVSLGVQMDSRVAIVGPNGAGKSTLLKLMAGDITPTLGEVRRHLHLKLGRYHQHTLEQLDSELTPLETIMKRHPENQNIEEWRQFLGKYGVSGPQQKTTVSKLSDGQKTRLVFALLADERPHILMLDEPTNHLDMEAIDGLAAAINKWNGGLVLVSHDFRLIDQVAKEIWLVDNGAVSPFKGDIHNYKKALYDKVEL